MSGARGNGLRGVARLGHAAAVVTGDYNRRIVSRGVDDRGPFAILECQHKVRKYADRSNETARWCKSCENRSPFR